ncbi:hypothetical protein ACHAXT_009129 [Thalassiosira profunda]
MALLYKIHNPDDFGKVFAAHDQYCSFLNELFGRMLTPEDDYYTAPFCFLPTSDISGFVVFTCRVPWLHGHGARGKRADSNFAHARYQVKECGFDPEDVPYVLPSVEKIHDHFSCGEEDIYTFTGDGCYPSKKDITPALEDRSVEVTCEAMGWDAPDDWRGMRELERADRFVVDVYDLELGGSNTNVPREEGSDNKRMKYSPGPYQALVSGSSQEEKKESFPQQNQSVDRHAHSISRSEDRNEARDEYYGHYGPQTGYSYDSGGGDTYDGGDSFYDGADPYGSMDDSDDLYPEAFPAVPPGMQHLPENFQEQQSLHSGVPDVVIDDPEEGNAGITVVNI